MSPKAVRAAASLRPGETQVPHAGLVAPVGHGRTPPSIIARLTADSAPGQAQVATAAGFRAVGEAFAGTMDGCARLLAAGVQEPGSGA